MAEAPVRSKEIIEDGLFAPTIASGKELETVLESLKISFAKITKETKAIAKSNNAFGSAAQVNEYTAALEKQQAVRKVVQKTEEQLLKQKERERLAEIRLAQQREKAFDNYEKQLQKKKAALEKQQERERLAEIRLAQQREKAFDNYEKQLQKKKAALEKQQERERLAEIRLAQQREKAFDNYEKKLKREKATLEKQNSAYNKLSKTVNELRKQYKDVAVAQGENSKAAKMLLAQLTPLDAKLKQIDANAGQFQRNVGNYPRVFGLAANAVKSLASAFGLFFGLRAVVGLFQNFVGTYRQFEDVNVRVASVLGTTTENTKELTEDAKRLGATTAKSATEVLLLQEAYARLGFTQKEILNLTEPTINGSIALNSELDQTAELVGAVVNSFDAFESANAPEILDQMTLATQRSALNFSYLETALPIVGAAANSAGVSFTELLSNLGKLADGGLDASTSATSLRNIFIESSTQGKNYREILGDIANSTDALVDSNDEFGKRGAVAATILSGQIDATKELESVLKDAGGTAERVANENLKTLSGAIILLKSAWDGFLLSLEEGNGTFGKALQTITRVTTEILTLATGTEKAKDQLNDAELRIREIAENFINLTKVIGSVIVGYASFRGAVIITNSVMKLNSFLSKLETTQLALKTKALNIATAAQNAFNKAQKANIIGFVVGAIIALATAMKMLKKDTDDATDAQKRFREEQQRILDQQERIRNINARIQLANQKRLSAEGLKTLRDDMQAEVDLIISMQDQKKASILAIEEEIAELTKNKEFYKAGVGYFNDDVVKANEKRLNILLEQLERIKQENFDVFENLEQNKVEYLKLLAQLTKAESKENAQRIRNVEYLNELIKAQQELIGKATTNSQVQAINERIKALENERDVILGTIQDYEKAYRDSRNRLIKDEETRELESINARFDDQIKALDKNGKQFTELSKSIEEERQQELQKIIDKYSEQRFEKWVESQKTTNDIEILDKEIQLAKITDKSSAEYKKLQQELIDLKIKALEAELLLVEKYSQLEGEEKVKRMKEIELEIALLRNANLENNAKTERDYLKQGTDALKATLDERNNLRQKYFDLETQERDRQIQIQSDRAAAGLTNQLAFEEAQQKKAAQARKEQLKREAREKEAFALSEVFVNSLNTNLKAGDSYGVAAGKALGSVGLAKGISKSLQYFEEGSEYVTQKGKKSPFSKGKDTVDAVVRVGEGIVTTEANQAYKGVVGAMNKGIFHELYTPKKVAVGVAESMANNVLLMQQMKANRLLEKIASKPSQMIEFDNFGNIIETVYRASIKERTTYKNSLSRFKK